MIAEKARLFNDYRAVELIMTSPDPSTHKRIGRGVRNFDSAVLGQREATCRVIWQLRQIHAESRNETSPFEHWQQPKKQISLTRTGHYLVDVLPQPGILSMQEHFVSTGRQVLPLTGVADLEPGDLVGVAHAPHLSVPLGALKHATHAAEPHPS